MAKPPRPRSRRPAAERTAEELPLPVEAVAKTDPAPSPGFWNGRRVWAAVVLLLTIHVVAAARSLVLENPTVDEVVHLPAGLTYWQTGSFRMYHHNPPLVRLVAALPVLLARPEMNYRSSAWAVEPPNKAQFAHEFMEANAARYFEIFTRARLMIPLFSLIGGLVVFLWSRSLYGPLAGLLSLTLWVVCPNVLAHSRLVTTDMGATALGVLATYIFWRYLKQPSWRLAALAGLALGIAQLSKFSLIVLYGLWPLLAVVRLASYSEYRHHFGRVVAQAGVILVASVLVINAGYLFEGVGIPLGDYEFVCATLTKPAPSGASRPRSADQLLDGAYRYRINRFRGSLLDRLPVPLPKHYVLGFDDQKLEAEGIPNKFLAPPGMDLMGEGDEVQGYPVYLDGVLRQKSWWYYYLMTLLYKVPEGTWLLVMASFGVLFLVPRARAEWFDEFAVLVIPAFVLLVMSVFTNINLGLRYVLPIFPYVYITTGKLVPWLQGLTVLVQKRVAGGFVALCLAASVGASASIYPHYLAYFNAVSGGPKRGSEHLIDSNLDWGQDLVGLRRWLQANAPGERVGLAYFGQVNPRVFEGRGEAFDWFLPPPNPVGVKKVTDLPYRYQLDLAGYRLKPGIYAVSASLVRGLPWRVYDSPWNGMGQNRWVPYPVWTDAFTYFQKLTPVANVGHSILIYRVTQDQADELGHVWAGVIPSRPPAEPASWEGKPLASGPSGL